MPGIPVGDLVVPGPTKTAYQITEIRPCDPREPIENETVVAAIDPVAGAATIVTRLPDLALEVVAAATDPDPTSDTVTDTASARTGTVVGSDGTTYELATGADGPAVVVTTPGGDPLRVELNGTLFPPVDLAGVPTFLSGVQFAPDGTPFVITGIHDGVYDPYLGSFGILEIAVLDPVSGAAKTTTVGGSEYGTLIFRADDTPVLYTHTARPGADGYDTAVTVVDLTAVKARSVTVAGYSTDYTVAADGTSFVVCMVDFDGTTGSVATYSLTAVNAETTASTTISLGGIPHGDMVLGPDGSVYQVVEMSDGDAVSTDVLIVRPGSLDITRIGLDGYPQSDVRFGPDGTGYVTTGTIDVHDATLRTVITVVAAAPTAHV